jgi:hypothetical protein
LQKKLGRKKSYIPEKREARNNLKKERKKWNSKFDQNN